LGVFTVVGATIMPTSNAGRTFPAEVLTDTEVQRLIRACSNRAPTGVRNRALIGIMYRAGLRCAEALSLFPKDIDRDAGTIRVLCGKGAKARTVGIDTGAMAVLDKWLEVRAKRGIAPRSPVFCTLRSTRLSPAYVRKMLPRMARRAGIDKRVHAHGLRHTHAAQLASEGVPINVISKQLGHSNVGTTSRYIDHIAPQQVIDTMRNREWSTS
jgi:site-specific recombinase XerD